MSDPVSTTDDPFALMELDEDAELRALSRNLQLAESFSLIFVRCNQPQQRQKLVADLRKRLPSLTIQEIHFGEPIPHLLRALRECLENSSLDAVFVSGIEYSLPIAAEAYATIFVANLNAARNSFPQVLPCPLVLWVPEYVITAIMRGAPDFFSIRSGVYYFAATPQETAGMAQSLTAGEGWQVANIPLAEKQERIVTIEGLLADYKALPPAQRDHHAEARLIHRLGNFYYGLGQWAEAGRCYQQSVTIYRDVGNRVGEGNALCDLGIVYNAQGRLADAETCYQQSLAICREFGDRVGERRAIGFLGNVYNAQGRLADAETCYQQSLAICREFGDRVGESIALVNLGNAYQFQERWMEAETCYQEGLAILREVGDRVGEGRTLNNLGNVYTSQGRWAEAETCYQQNLAICREVGHRVEEGGTLKNLGLLREAQRAGGALEFGRQAVAVLEKTEAKAALEEVRQWVAEL